MSGIGVLCATRRGVACLERLLELGRGEDFVVCSFREEPSEPPFLDDIRRIASQEDRCRFLEVKRLTPELALLDEIDVLIAINWRYMVPGRLFRRMGRGAYVFHDSLLPEYRGFSPTVWAMVNGEDHTGVTLFEMNDAVDAGPIVDQESVPIGGDESIAEVVDRVTHTYLSLISRNFIPILQGRATGKPQDESRATYVSKRKPEDNVIDWSNSTQRTYNLIRAVSRPYPGAITTLNGKRLRIWAARRGDSPHSVGRPGRVVDVSARPGALVLTGDGCLRVLEVELEGDSVRPAEQILSSLEMTLG